MKRNRMQTKTEVIKHKMLSDGIEEFIKNCRVRNLSEYTIRYYNGVSHMIHLFCDYDTYNIHLIDEAFVDDFYLFLKAREIRDMTVATYIKGLRTILYFL